MFLTWWVCGGEQDYACLSFQKTTLSDALVDGLGVQPDPLSQLVHPFPCCSQRKPANFPQKIALSWWSCLHRDAWKVASLPPCQPPSLPAFFPASLLPVPPAVSGWLIAADQNLAPFLKGGQLFSIICSPEGSPPAALFLPRLLLLPYPFVKKPSINLWCLNPCFWLCL